MDRVVAELRQRALAGGIASCDDEVFELLELAWCPFCCRDGARGGNENCGVKVAPEV
jgi:hypothetical protein